MLMRCLQGAGLAMARRVNRTDVLEEQGPPQRSFPRQNSTRCELKVSVCVTVQCVLVCNHSHLSRSGCRYSPLWSLVAYSPTKQYSLFTFYHCCTRYITSRSGLLFSPIFCLFNSTQGLHKEFIFLFLLHISLLLPAHLLHLPSVSSPLPLQLLFWISQIAAVRCSDPSRCHPQSCAAHFTDCLSAASLCSARRARASLSDRCVSRRAVTHLQLPSEVCSVFSGLESRDGAGVTLAPLREDKK